MDTAELIIALLGTSGVSVAITTYFTKGKTDAETENLIGKSYQEVLGSLRKEIDRLEERLNSSEAREVEYLKIIGQHKQVEFELRNRIKELEMEMSLFKKTDHEKAIKV